MFNKKRLFVPAALILAGLIGVSKANAQDPTCPYTLASLQGSYAVIVNYGANVAIGLQTQVLACLAQARHLPAAAAELVHQHGSGIRPESSRHCGAVFESAGKRLGLVRG